MHPQTLVLGIFLLTTDIDTVAIVGIGIRVLDAAVLGPPHDAMWRPRAKILQPLGRVREDPVKAGRRKHLLRVCYLESLDRRASSSEERRYGDQQARTAKDISAHADQVSAPRAGTTASRPPFSARPP